VQQIEVRLFRSAGADTFNFGQVLPTASLNLSETRRPQQVVGVGMGRSAFSLLV